MNEIRVILADDHLLFLEGLSKILLESKEYDINIVGKATSGEELIQIVKVSDPDIIFLDLNMPNMDGLEAFRQLKESDKDFKIIVLTMYDDDKIIKPILKAGVDGYILKKYGVKEVFRAMREVLLGNVYFSNGVEFNNQKALLEKGNNKFDDKFIKKHKLTKREKEVLLLIGQAMSNKQIAKVLFISDQTVSVHRKNIMRKLGVSNTAGLIKVAYDNSLIK